MSGTGCRVSGLRGFRLGCSALDQQSSVGITKEGTGMHHKDC